MTHTTYLKLFISTCIFVLASCATQDEGPFTDTQGRTTTLKPKRSYEYPSHALTGTYANNRTVKKFITHMVNAHGFEESYLNDLFSQANRLHYVMRLENVPPYSGPKNARPKLGSWVKYRRQFLDEAHITNGVRFWAANAGAIAEASETYNVDPEYIVAIIGVETFYGRNMGNTCTFDALTTLAFDTSRRSKFFQDELENFLLMSREENYTPTEPVGSWAGAMGFGQFMPSSFRRLAVDFNKDGKRNLWHQHDAIGSVAHYFSRHGWQFHQSVAERAIDDSEPGTFALGSNNGHEFWRAYPNFEVIKKYNNNNKYAMAVHQLAQALKERH